MSVENQDKLDVAFTYEGESEWRISASIEGEQIGRFYGILWGDDTLGYKGIHVDPPHRGRGIASMVVKYLVEHFNEYNIRPTALTMAGSKFFSASGGIVYRANGDEIDSWQSKCPSPKTHLIPKQDEIDPIIDNGK